MTLPTSRDFNAIDGGPLAASTINNIQDSIVNGAHGSIVLHIPGSAFQHDAASAVTYLNDSTWALGAGSLTIPIQLPVGAIVSKFEVFGNDGAATEFTLNMFEVRLSTGVTTTMGTNSSGAISPVTKSSGQTNGDVTVVYDSADTGMPVTVGALAALYILVNNPGASITIHGAQVTYHMT